MATKSIPREALNVLRQFQVAGQRSTAAEVSDVKEYEPRTTTRLVTVTFMKTKYVVIFDDTAEDDTSYMLEMLKTTFPGVTGKFLRNPHDANETYGIRFKFHEVYVFEVIPKKVRLDHELSRRYPDMTRSTIQKYIKAGHVEVDGEVTLKPNHDVSEVTDIALTMPPEEDFSKQSFPILYLDDDVIVINKPVGVLTHSKGALNNEFTVADFFRRYTTDGLDTQRPGIVHRLDRDTSGVIIGARHERAALHLKKQFANRTAKKQYAAVVDGHPKQDEALIDLPIGRNPSKPSTFRVDPQGKPAITVYSVEAANNSHSLLELKPRTGRTHQLRVHMQYIGNPISGDRVYGSTKSAPRLCLHAEILELTLPNTERKEFTAPPPALFEELTR